MMERASASQAQPDSQNLSHNEVDGLLLSSKKIRYRNRKACYPCNKRKIKCDRDEQPPDQPCTNCRKRPHPELCSYEDRNPRSSGGSTRSVNQNSHPATPVQQPSQYGGTPAQVQPILSGIHAASVAYVPETSQPEEQSPAAWPVPPAGNYRSSYGSNPQGSGKTGQSQMSGLNQHPAESVVSQPGAGLSTRFYQPSVFASHPAAVTQQTSGLWEEINSLLPPQKHILRYFELYRTVCAPLNPIIPNLDELEAVVCNHVESLGNGQLLTRIVSLHGHHQEAALTRLGQILAVLASGIQFSDIPFMDRIRLVQEHVRNALRCLRLANFVLRPSTLSVQTLLLLAVVLQNHIQPEASWAIISTTRALAQTISYQATPLQAGRADNILEPEHLAAIWQETALAVCLGRQSTGLPDITSSTSLLAGLSYEQCMRVILEVLPKARNPSSGELDEAIAAVRKVGQYAVLRLQNKEHCRSIQDRIAYFAYRIQTSFLITSLLVNRDDHERPTAKYDKASIASQCRSCCIHTVSGFLDMQVFTVIPLRTWNFLYSALACALLLGFVGEKDDQEAIRLQQSLYEILVRLEEDGGPISETSPLFQNRYARAMEELKRMISGGHHVGQANTHDENMDTDMSDELKMPIPNLAKLWQTYFADIAGTDNRNPTPDLHQQSAWGL